MDTRTRPAGLYPDDYEPRLAPRFAEVATFMRTPLVRDPAGLDVALVGVPYDGAISIRSGAREGPRAVRHMSTMTRAYHPTLRFSPYERCRVADVGDVVLEHMYSIEETLGDIEQFYAAIHAAGARPLSAGGDHSITLPILRAIARERPVGLVQVDAHTDTWNEFQGSRYNHGTQFRRAVEEGLVDPRRTVQIGIRGAQNTMEGWEYSLASGMRVIFMEEFSEIGIHAVVAETLAAIGDGPIYVSFDVDGLDPVYAPGTGSPEVGGITTIEAYRILRALHGREVVGGDVVEISPPHDVADITALTAANMMYEILCLMASPGR